MYSYTSYCWWNANNIKTHGKTVIVGSCEGNGRRKEERGNLKFVLLSASWTGLNWRYRVLNVKGANGLINRIGYLEVRISWKMLHGRDEGRRINGNRW